VCWVHVSQPVVFRWCVQLIPVIKTSLQSVFRFILASSPCNDGACIKQPSSLALTTIFFLFLLFPSIFELYPTVFQTNPSSSFYFLFSPWLWLISVSFKIIYANQNLFQFHSRLIFLCHILILILLISIYII
jgi:hypothetical protein